MTNDTDRWSGPLPCSTTDDHVAIERTARGFQFVGLRDANGVYFTLQQSSAIDDTDRGMGNPGSSFVWLGSNDSRIHLHRTHVRKLVGVLQRWLDHGAFGTDPVESSWKPPFPCVSSLPQPTLTAEEREAVETAAKWCEEPIDPVCSKTSLVALNAAATLRSLLQRLGGNDA